METKEVREDENEVHTGDFAPDPRFAPGPWRGEIVTGEVIKRSADLNEFVKAFCQVQRLIGNAKRDSENPFFSSKYAQLDAVLDAIRVPLAEAGIAVFQGARTASVRYSKEPQMKFDTQTRHRVPVLDNGEPVFKEKALPTIEVETLFVHESGQWISTTLSAESQEPGPQPYGTVMTYLRRYGVKGLAGIAEEDDDGESAQGGRPEGGAEQKRGTPPGRTGPAQDELTKELAEMLWGACLEIADGEEEKARVALKWATSSDKFQGFDDVSRFSQSWQPENAIDKLRKHPKHGQVATDYMARCREATGGSDAAKVGPDVGDGGDGDGVV